MMVNLISPNARERKTMRGEKRDVWVASRTLEAVKDAVRAEARSQRRTESELVHLMLCDRYGLDPFSGRLVTEGPGEGARDA
jgi:hypothetical protein